MLNFVLLLFFAAHTTLSCEFRSVWFIFFTKISLTTITFPGILTDTFIR